MYEISDLSQWYNGKVVARTDAAMMNKRLLFELKKYNDRVNAIENNDTYTATQLKLIAIQADKVTQNTSTFTDFFRKRIEELKKRRARKLCKNARRNIAYIPAFRR